MRHVATITGQLVTLLAINSACINSQKSLSIMSDIAFATGNAVYAGQDIFS